MPTVTVAAFGGAKIIAHDNTRKHLSGISGSRLGLQFPSLSLRRSSSEVFAQEHSLKLNGASLALKYYGPAHTDGDISVTFAEANVIHVGDTYWNGIYPFIDYSTGGSIDGMIAASNANLAAATNDTIIPFRVTAAPSATKPNCRNSEICWLRLGQCRQAQEGRTQPGRGGRGQAGRIRREVGPVRHRPGFFTRLVYEGV